MREAVRRGKAFARDVGVDLRRSQARVTEDLLHGAQIGATVEKMGGCGVTQRVRTCRAAHGGSELACDEVVDRTRPDTGTSNTEEECGRRALA